MNWSRVERSMLGPEKKAKGFTLIELLVVIAIIGFISSLSYPSFSSWIETRNTNDAVTKVETAFRSITTQIQRGVYPFVQIHVENFNDKIIIVIINFYCSVYLYNKTFLIELVFLSADLI